MIENTAEALEVIEGLIAITEEEPVTPRGWVAIVVLRCLGMWLENGAQ